MLCKSPRLIHTLCSNHSSCLRPDPRDGAPDTSGRCLLPSSIPPPSRNPESLFPPHPTCFQHPYQERFKRAASPCQAHQVHSSLSSCPSTTSRANQLPRSTPVGKGDCRAKDQAIPPYDARGRHLHAVVSNKQEHPHLHHLGKAPIQRRLHVDADEPRSPALANSGAHHHTGDLILARSVHLHCRLSALLSIHASPSGEGLDTTSACFGRETVVGGLQAHGRGAE